MRRFAGFEKGINLGGWFSQCDHSKKRYDTFINEHDIAELSTWGIDHLRLPIDYNLVEDKDGNYIEEGFARIEKVIVTCRRHKLNMVLDLHKTAGFSFDQGEAETGFFSDSSLQERFYRLWEELARRFAKYTDTVAFELLNEVTDKCFCSLWNSIAATCIKRIRAICSDVYILVGGYWNNSIDALADLDPPCDDKIVYNFHCYEPLLFTHQGAYWVREMPKHFRMKFPDTVESYQRNAKSLELHSSPFIDQLKDGMVDASLFDNLFAQAVKVAEERNALLYCGEYGVINLADLPDTLAWYKAINAAFVKYNIGRCAWSYREMDFGLCDEHAKPILNELKHYL